MDVIMETVNSSSGNASNDTEQFDIFCTNLYVGTLVWGIFTVPCVCIAVPASVWLMRVLIHRQRSGLSNDVYMLNLTVMDLICNIFRIPLLLNYLVWRNMMFVDICLFMEGFNLNGRPFFTAFICVDCYIAVVHPISYMKMKNSRYRLVICVLGWITTLLLNLYGVYRGLHHISVRGVLRVFTISIITFCNVAILYTLQKPDPSGRNGIHPQKQRALHAVTNSFIMTMVSYLPQTLASLVAPLIPLNQQEVWCNILVPNIVCALLGATIMPVLYLGNLGSLKKLEKAFCAICE